MFNKKNIGGLIAIMLCLGITQTSLAIANSPHRDQANASVPTNNITIEDLNDFRQEPLQFDSEKTLRISKQNNITQAFLFNKNVPGRKLDLEWILYLSLFTMLLALGVGVWYHYYGKNI